MPAGSVSRSDTEQSLASHEKRIRDLEWTTGGVIRFDVQNLGGWLYVQTGATIDLDTTPDPLAVGGTWGMVFEDGTGAGAVFGSTGEVRIQSGSGLQLAGSPVFVGNDLFVSLSTGGKVQVKDHAGNPIFEVRDDGSLHGKAGQTLTFDL